METIVVGVDGSQQSLDALRWAVEEALLRSAKVVALHAWSVPQTVTAYGALNMPVNELDALQKAARELLDTAIAGAAPDTSVEILPVTVEGTPAAALVAAAQDADLVVVGSRGFGGFKGLLLGSVSQQVAHHAPSPVVVIRTSVRDSRDEIEPVGAAQAKP